MKILILKIIRIPNLNTIVITTRQTIVNDLKHINKMVHIGHFILIQMFELKHQGTNVVAKRFQVLQKLSHEFSGKEIWVGSQRGVFVFVVMMSSQGDAVQNLDAEGKIWWY